MTNKNLFAAARFTRPEPTESVAGTFIYSLGIALTVIVIVAAVLL